MTRKDTLAIYFLILIQSRQLMIFILVIALGSIIQKLKR